jgi:O-antigen ligase
MEIGVNLRRRETWLFVLVYLLFLFTPLSISAVTAATILLYGAVLYHRARKPIEDPLPPWLWGGFILLPAAAVLSALANPDPLANLAHLRKEYAIFLPLALLPALDQSDRKRLLLAYGVPVALVAVYGLIQHIWGVDWFRTEGHKLITPAREPGSNVFHGKGTFSHHLTFAGFVSMHVPFFLALAISERGRLRYAFGIIAIMSVVATLVSLGRSGWLGAAGGVLLLILGFPRRILLPLAALTVLLAVAGTSIYGGWQKGLMPYEGQPGFVKRLLMTSLEHDKERIHIWEAALLGIRDRPVLGVGYGNDKKYTPEYRRQISEANQYQFLIGPKTHAHNVYLQVAFELGFVGLAAYLYMWGAVFYWNWLWVKRAGQGCPWEQALLAGASCALMGSMVSGLFENNFFDAEVRTIVLVMMGLSLHAGLLIRHAVARERDTSPGGPALERPLTGDRTAF